MKKSNVLQIIDTCINPLVVIAFAVVLRLLPHPANVAPIGAMALFGGVYFSKKYALVVPLLAMIVSDFFLGFHATIPFVYGSFFLIGLIGLLLKKHKKIEIILAATLLSSVLFFLITNFGVWLIGGLYPKTFQGLVTCYSLAIPFFRSTMIGDLLYTGIFFGAYEAALRFKNQQSRIKNHVKSLNS